MLVSAILVVPFKSNGASIDSPEFWFSIFEEKFSFNFKDGSKREIGCFKLIIWLFGEIFSFKSKGPKCEINSDLTILLFWFSKEEIWVIGNWVLFIGLGVWSIAFLFGKNSNNLLSRLFLWIVLFSITGLEGIYSPIFSLGS